MEAQGDSQEVKEAQIEEGSPSSAPQVVLRRIASRWPFLAVAVTGGALDLITKSWAFRVLGADPTRPIPDTALMVIPGIFQIKAAVNPGSLGGIFREHSGILTVVTAGIFLLLVWIAFCRSGRAIGMQLALGLFCAGAIGNLTDRILLGHVRDFLDVRYWPTFNLADTCISIGAVVFILVEWRRGRSAAASREAGVERVVSGSAEGEGG